MKILVIDVGGTNVKLLATGQKERRKFPSGPKMTPRRMVAGVTQMVADWDYDAVSIGYPGVVRKGRIVEEPHNLAKGWVRFNFKAAFKRPVKIINDAAMQALGSYRDGTMLFLGLGTGLGSALMVRGHIVPMELGQLPFKRGVIEEYVGVRGLKRLGKKQWRNTIELLVARFVSALELDEVVLGGGNAKNLAKLPRRCRAGNNANAFLGGFRLWEKTNASGAFPKRKS